MNFPEQYSVNRTPEKLPPSEDHMQQPDRWLGPSTDVRKRKPLSNECLAALREAAADKGRMLKDEERAVIIQKCGL
jgi:hypothetical protein